MNPRLEQLQPYPFQKLRALFDGVTPAAKPAINLSIGEPKHATPEFIKTALVENLGGLSNYPLTAGSDALRSAIAAWCQRRYGVALDAATQILPVNGSREALFAFAQAVVNPKKHVKRVVSPNPFYQIYEGAALLAGAVPYFLNTLPDDDFRLPLETVPEEVWADTHLMFVCSPGNPTGKVLNLDDWRAIFALADRYGFVIASDECYSEIYFDTPPLGSPKAGFAPPWGEASAASKGAVASPPLGALSAAQQLGRGCERLVVFNSLSKRSNVPGLRSGFVAGDATVLKDFLLYRTYHGCAMSPPVQAASAAAWSDEAHVEDNRRQYREKFAAVMPLLQGALSFNAPDASFYLWARVPGHDDAAFVRELYREQNVTLLPGSYLAREAGGVNPGAGFVRIALVEPLPACVEAAERIRHFIQNR